MRAPAVSCQPDARAENRRTSIFRTVPVHFSPPGKPAPKKTPSGIQSPGGGTVNLRDPPARHAKSFTVSSRGLLPPPPGMPAKRQELRLAPKSRALAATVGQLERGGASIDAGRRLAGRLPNDVQLGRHSFAEQRRGVETAAAGLSHDVAWTLQIMKRYGSSGDTHPAPISWRFT